MPRPLGLAVLALLAALVPSSVAVHQTDDDLNALDLNVVLHHPFPDEKADPWGFAATDVNGTGRDWLGAYYGSSVYPTAIFDGLMIVESVPQKEGAGAYNETYEGYRRIMEVRREAPSALALHVIGSVGGTVEAEATFVPARAWTETGLVPRFVLYEDDVPYNGGNG
ncbi:MAG: hypothetical protein HYT80_11845, partial [Euryarchaeota archaeon]|nr:hypothetical protein [Euryarchaeota archaeon]